MVGRLLAELDEDHMSLDAIEAFEPVEQLVIGQLGEEWWDNLEDEGEA